MTFIEKKDIGVRIEAFNLLHLLCTNATVQKLLLKETQFSVLAKIIKDPLAAGHPAQIRAKCFEILVALLANPSKLAYKQLLYKQGINAQLLAGKLAAEDSEQVKKAILLFILQVTSDVEMVELLTQDAMIVSILCSQIDQRGTSTETVNLTYAVVVNLLR